MALIDKDATLTAIATKAKAELADVNYHFLRGIQMAVDVVEKQPEQMQWHECFEDDPGSFPSDERMVLMSFSNFPTPAIGWFERDDNGGYWTDGDPKTLIELGLFVDGWWELPRKPRRN
jgi:hypothetical protein